MAGGALCCDNPPVFDRECHHNSRQPLPALMCWIFGAGVLLGGLGVGCRGATLAPVEDPAPTAGAADLAISPAATALRPRLLVVLVVDQMRADYLTRFDHLFEHGFARLRSEGARFEGAEIAHAVTMTSPGHATIATGTDPRRHGVIQNNWIDRPSGEPAYAVDDPGATIVGPPGSDTSALAGRSSVTMRSPTIGAWLKASSPASKVLSIAYKDRASVLMAGKAADGVFWYEAAVDAYVTSSAFARELPPWVVEFDRSSVIGDAIAATWERSLPDSAYAFVGPDEVEAEGPLAAFPHRLEAAGDGTSAAFYRLGASPMSDRMSFELALQGLTGAGLGADDAPDLLMLSLSGADLVGHTFGPDSHEIVDYYVDLDRRLGDFLGELDRRYPGDYAVIVTADHGGTRMPEVARTKGQADATRVPSEEFDREVKGAVTRASERLGLAEPVAVRDVGEGLWLDLEAAQAGGADGRGVDAVKIREAVAEELRGLPFVVDAYTYDELADPSGAAVSRRPWLQRYALGFVADRSPDVQLRGPEGWLLNARPTGTSHGTPYADDTEIPLMIFGEGIPAVVIDTPVRTRDVAPTAAALLGLPAPDVDGRSLLPLLRSGS